VRRRLVAPGLLAIAVAFALDRWLAARRGSRPPRAMSMLEVVDAPIGETWAVLSDIPRQPEWMREMKRVALTTPGPVGVGTRGDATVRILGIGVRDPVEVTGFDPPTRFAVRHDGLFRGSGVITLEAGADGTTTIVRWSETLIPPVLPELGAVAQAPVLRAVFQEDLHRLRRLVETGSAGR
jgi:Polyketide cyclase / dehydrase and lipid transport